MASTKLSRTAGTPTSSKKFTISFWVKRSNIGSAGNGHIFDTYVDGSNRSQIHFDDDNVIDFRLAVSGSNIGRLKTNRVFRDTSAWYHIVASVNTTLGAADDRVKLYINGVQETSFSSRINPSVNADFPMAGTHTLGAYGGGTNYFDGTLSYFAFVDGTAYTPTSFGETNAASGIWKINTAPSFTYANNGFFLKMDTTSPGSDTSGNDNTFTAAGTPTLAQDNASNNLATNNPLCNIASRWTTTNGNNTIQHANGGAWTAMISSIGSSQGKYYMETKITAGASRVMFGVMSMDTNIMGYETNLDSICLYYNLSGGEFQQSGGTTSGNNYGTFADNDIAGIAVDCTNNKLSIYKNGSALVTNHTIPATVNGFIGFGFTSDSNSTIYQCNYGNGIFGTTSVSSAGTNASGIGIFEYDVPSGYTALSTKGLNL